MTGPRTASAARRALVAAIAAAALLGACSRSPAGPASWEEAMRPVGDLVTVNRWSEVFARCEPAFRLGEKEGQGRAVHALDCLAEAAAREGKPQRALPYFEKFFKDDRRQLEQAGALHRLANNHGVLLLESGKRDEGIARLEEAFDALPDEPSGVDGKYGSPRAMVVRNLARAYYGRASEPRVRAWVKEQGEWYRDYMEANARGGVVAAGAVPAMAALIYIGRRQANLDTPAWEAKLAEYEPREESAVSQNPNKARACEIAPTGLEVCLRELKALD